MRVAPVALTATAAALLLAGSRGSLAVKANHLLAPGLSQDGLKGVAWNDFEDIFIDIGDAVIDLGDVFVDGFSEVEEFFSEDMVYWLETGFEGYMWLCFEIADKTLEFEKWHLDFWTADTFMTVWDTSLDGMKTAWEWTENAAITAWSEVEDLWEKLDCFMEETVAQGGGLCLPCIEDQCNSSLDQKTIAQIETANNLAVMDMNDEFDSMINGCASAMQSCPTIQVCNDLNSISPETQKYLQKEIAQCNLCYQCLPYGSTNEGCKPALEQLMPNHCAGCSEAGVQMYKAFYSCSGLKVIHDSIANVGKSYEKGATGYESLNELCKFCEDCGDYQADMLKICSDWETIKAGWDREAPKIPQVLVPAGVVVEV